MQLDFNLYAVTLLALGIAAGFLSLFILYRLDTSVKWFAITLLNSSIWVFFYGLELASPSLSAMYFWLKIEYLGIVLIPFAWLIFCFKYTGNDGWLNNKLLVVSLFFVSVLTYLIFFTNESHFLYYTTVGIYSEGLFPVIDTQKGPWYYLFIFYFYFAILWGNYLLLEKSSYADAVFKRQNYFMVAVTSIPLVVDVMSLAGHNILGYIDVTPFAFIVSFFVTGLGLVKFNLFNVIPVAKEQLIVAMTDGLAVVNTKGKIVEVNPAMKTILGQNNEKYIGRSIVEILSAERPLGELVQGRVHRKIEITLAVGSEKRMFSVEIIPLMKRGSQFKGTLLLFRDITEAKFNHSMLESQAEQLKKHNELKDKLFSIISHDLKGPVLGVKEIIDLTKKGYINTEEFTEILPALSDSVDGVTMLLENLLAWSRSQLKGEFTDKVIFDVYKLIRQQLALMKPIALLKNIELKTDADGSTMVFADKNMVELIIRNLLNNAVKFCEAGDSISVSIHDLDEEVKITVKDTGLGISESNLDRLRRGDTFSTFGSNNESGTGLGLLLVRDYVEKNGGNLWIESQENEWSEFSFILPKININ